MYLIKTGLGLALALSISAAGAAHAQNTPVRTAFEATTLDLSADGEVKVVPDQASISLGVATQAATAAQALAANAAKMNQVMAVLHAAGIAERDVQTSRISLQAQYAYKANEAPSLTGYEASNAVTITVNDLKRLGPTLDSVVGAGANQVNGVSFGLKDPHAAEDAARRAAVGALKAKADLYAQATGYRLTRMVSLSEGGGYAPSPVTVPVAAYAARAAVAPTPVSAGELTVRVTITGVYELTR
jgi:uncharacterized protein YggE